MPSQINFFSLILTGLLDSINLGGLTCIIIFTVFIFGITKWLGPALIDLLGWGFVAGLALTVPLVNIGICDRVISSKIFDVILQLAHFVVELACVIIAVISLRDWWIYKSTQDPRKLVIQYPLGAQQHTPKSRILVFLLFSFAFISGAALAFLISIWPGNQQYFSVLLSAGIQLTTIFSLIIYGFTFAFPLIVELIIFKEAVTSPELGKRLERNLSKLQVVVAGVFFAYGATMIYFYYILYYLANY